LPFVTFPSTNDWQFGSGRGVFLGSAGGGASVGVLRGGLGVLLGGIAVGLGGTAVGLGGTGVGLGGTGLGVGGTGVGLGGIAVGVGGMGVGVGGGGTGVSVGEAPGWVAVGNGVLVGGGTAPCAPTFRPGSRRQVANAKQVRPATTGVWRFAFCMSDRLLRGLSRMRCLFICLPSPILPKNPLNSNSCHVSLAIGS